MAKRGELTPQIEQRMKAWLGRDVTERELRLYPYLLYRMVNERFLNPMHINGEERAVLRLLKDGGHIEGGATGLAMTKDFFLFANGIVFDAYAAYDNEQPDPELLEGGPLRLLGEKYLLARSYIQDGAMRSAARVLRQAADRIDEHMDACDAIERSEK